MAPSRTLLPIVALALAGISPSSAEAVEVRLDGIYRVRAELYDTLSLDKEHEETEGVRHFLRQRLRLVPHLRINPNVHVFIDFDVLDALRFGASPEVLAATGQLQENGEPFDEPVPFSGSVLPGEDYRESLFVRRAWAEIYTPYVDFKVGRMSSHWGMGLLANDGNCDTCDYGDIVDRVMVSTSAIDPVRLSLAVDTRAEGFINADDDTHSFLLSGGYLGEVHRIGAYVRWTRQPSNKFNLLHGDLWGATQLGPLSMELEALITWGAAETTDIGIDDFKVLSGGGAFRAGLAVNPWEVGLELGLASGDKDPTDNQWHTFTMDRDHDLGLILFEQALPSYSAGPAASVANGNIDASRAVIGEGISNAFYVKPHFAFDIRDNLRAQVNLAAAFAVVPEAFDGEKIYGMEVGGEVRWRLFGAFELGGRMGVLIPGPILPEDSDPVFGGELRTLVHF